MTGNWRNQAACLGRDPHWWHPPASEAAGCYAKARPICNGCPVRTDCLNFALAVEDAHVRCGMYGGHTPNERARIAAGQPVVVRRWIRQPSKVTTADVEHALQRYAAIYGSKPGAITWAALQLAVHPNTIRNNRAIKVAA